MVGDARSIFGSVARSSFRGGGAADSSWTCTTRHDSDSDPDSVSDSDSVFDSDSDSDSVSDSDSDSDSDSVSDSDSEGMEWPASYSPRSP
ncbi:MAG: hypothetical protein AB7S26_23160 [Sandaracinaceae bacterium]